MKKIDISQLFGGRNTAFRQCMLSLCLTVALLPGLGAEQKTALLIANADYASFGRLETPVIEARQLRDTLTSIGFSVTLVENARREEMFDALSDFEASLKQQGGIAFFHFGGHGLQIDGKNYLIPADADIPDERRVETRAVAVDEIMATLDAASTSASIVILDACRNNPLPAQTARSASRGLSVVGFKPKNSIIVYSAEAGCIAQDGLFTPALSTALAQEGKSFQEILMEVRKQVSAASGGTQIPGEYNQTFESIYLAGFPEAQTRSGQDSAVSSGSIASAPLAAARVASDRTMMDLVSVEGGTFTMGESSGERHQVTLSAFTIGGTEVTQTQYESVMGQNPSKFKGSDRPVDGVNWFDAVEFCNALSRMEGLTPAYIIETSNDMTKALTYIFNETVKKQVESYSKKYLRQKYAVRCDWAANGYRLPTEAEWEYAARGGISGAGYKFSGSDTPSEAGWFQDNSLDSTQSVAQKKANELGLYDMSGNVREWCWDFKAQYVDEDQTDPKGPYAGSDRILRGGSWDDDDNDMESTERSGERGNRRDSTLGFRVARSAY